MKHELKNIFLHLVIMRVVLIFHFISFFAFDSLCQNEPKIIKPENPQIQKHDSLPCLDSLGRNCIQYNGGVYFFPLNSFSSINCKDSLGRKQGWWIEDYNGSPSYYSSHGQYMDNKKIQTWYYVYSGHLNWIDYKEIFLDDSSRILIAGNEVYKINFNNDSSEVYGTYILYSIDTLTIICKGNSSRNEKTCKTLYRNIILSSYPVEKIDVELIKIQSNAYRFPIQAIKNKN